MCLYTVYMQKMNCGPEICNLLYINHRKQTNKQKTAQDIPFIFPVPFSCRTNFRQYYLEGKDVKLIYKSYFLYLHFSCRYKRSECSFALHFKHMPKLVYLASRNIFS